MTSHREWPRCIGENATLLELRRGASLARFGDGELKCADGSGYGSQQPQEGLRDELQELLRSPPASCLVGIPTMSPRVTNAQFWEKHRGRFMRLLGDGPFASAFTFREDMAPWIDCHEYAATVSDLWGSRRVVVVAPEGSKAFWIEREDAEVVPVVCPERNAYDAVDELEAACHDADAELAILSAGPTATALAARLSREGLQAIDIGKGVRFVHKWRERP